MIKFRYVFLLALLSSASAVLAEDPAGPEDTVRAFNTAIGDRNLDAVLAQLLGGGVHFNLRPSHQGQGDTTLTSELIPRWSMVGPVLFSTTKTYQRDLEIIDTQQHGEIATVWATVRTETVMLSDGKRNQAAFTEVYLLANTPSGWKIAGVADNRQPNDVGMAGN
jgi:hypothetical protein